MLTDAMLAEHLAVSVAEATLLREQAERLGFVRVTSDSGGATGSVTHGRLTAAGQAALEELIAP